MLWQNASIRKESFPPTQFNEFAAVKQANLLAFKRGQNLLYHAVIPNKSLTS